jgi:DNA-binding beta-propeller fold protein YncE
MPANPPLPSLSASRTIGRLVVAPALVLALAVAGCAAAGWSLRVSRPELALQWPYLPSPAKVTYDRALGGVTRDKTAGSVLRAVAWGGGVEDSDAFALPVAVAAAPDGRLAVADAGRACVHLYLPESRRYARLAGTPERRLRSPVGLAFDGEGALWVSDSSGALFAYAPDGAPRRVIEHLGQARLERPTGLAWSASRQALYVVDTQAHAVRVLDARGELIATFGRHGDQPGEFNYPTHIAVSAGTVYVTDALNFRIQTFDEDGHFISAFGEHGDGSGDLAMPKGLAVDGDGVVYLADAILDNVQLFDKSGAFLLTVGRRGSDFGEFWLPAGLFLSANGELYVCDTYNRRVQVFRVTEGYAPPS